VKADPLIIALDFDSVLHQYSKWTGPTPEEPPVAGAQEFVRSLVDDGFEVVVFSHRAATTAGKEGIIEWLVEYGFPAMDVSDRKPPAEVFVDDRAVRFEGDFDATYAFIVDKKKRTPWNR
jgi:hypothetical protein